MMILKGGRYGLPAFMMVLVLAFGSGCTFTSQPSEQYTHTTIIEGPGNNSTIRNHTFVFKWTAPEYIAAFRWRLDDEPWTGWKTDTTATYTYVDDGRHTFRVTGRDQNGFEEDHIDSSRFRVDLFQGPTLRISPLRIVSGPDADFSLMVVGEELDSVAAMQFDLVGYSRFGTYASAEPADWLADQSPDYLFLADQYQDSTITISIGVLGLEHGLNGTGDLAELSFLAASTTVMDSLKVENVLFRDCFNRVIQVGTPGYSRVEVQ